MIINDQSKHLRAAPWGGGAEDPRVTLRLSQEPGSMHDFCMRFVHCPGEYVNLKTEGRGQRPCGHWVPGNSPQHTAQRSSREHGTH